MNKNTIVENICESIVKEGIEKGKAEEKKILVATEKEKENILEKANKKAKEILKIAKEKSNLMISQANSLIKSEINEKIDSFKNFTLKNIFKKNINEELSKYLSSNNAEVIIKLAKIVFENLKKEGLSSNSDTISADIKLKTKDIDIEKFITSALKKFSSNLSFTYHGTDTGIVIYNNDKGLFVNLTSSTISDIIWNAIKDKTSDFIFNF